MSSNNRKGQYTTLRIAPSIYAKVNEMVAKWQNLYNRKWSVSSYVNVSLLDSTEKYPDLNEEAIAALLEKYEELKTGYAGNLK
jgi:hypothetical protein